MNGIIGLSSLALDTDDLPPSIRETLNMVHSLANSLLTIIDDILDISKIEANRMVIERQPFSLGNTVFSVLKALAHESSEKALSLRFIVDGKVCDYLIGDAYRLRQIIMNLVGNAIKFTDHGEVQVSIKRAEDSEPDEAKFEFSVSDPGIGIEETKLGLIFNKFQQADGSMTRRFGGTGLGLAISKRLVSLMGGDIWVTSNIGQGSKFSFTCRGELADTPAGFMDQLRPHRGRRVLFIDDGHVGAFPVAKILVELGLDAMIITHKQLVAGQCPPEWACPFEAILVSSIETAIKLRDSGNLNFALIPLVIIAPKLSIVLKPASELGIASYVTTPCRPIDLWNGIFPALGNRVPHAQSGHSRSLAVLLAEDNDVNQKVAVRILEKSKHAVTVVENGLQAVKEFKNHRYDVVLMDVQMPVMGGFEATSKIRLYEKVNKLIRTPIVALTAHAMMGDREKCLESGMDDYVSKPLNSTLLMQTISKCTVGNLTSLPLTP